MRVIDGHRDMIEADRKRRREARKERLRFIMLESNDPAKVFHAAARWYVMRDKWETPSESEFGIHNSMVQLLAEEFSPAWLAREFPAIKTYDGQRYGGKDYFTSMRVLQESEPFDGDIVKVQDFIWSWHNFTLGGFMLAGIHILDELRAMEGKTSIMEEWADIMGVQVYHSIKVEGGKKILLDEKGRSLGRMYRPHGNLKVVEKRTHRSLSESR